MKMKKYKGFTKSQLIHGLHNQDIYLNILHEKVIYDLLYYCHDDAKFMGITEISVKLDISINAAIINLNNALKEFIDLLHKSDIEVILNLETEDQNIIEDNTIYLPRKRDE